MSEFFLEPDSYKVTVVYVRDGSILFPLMYDASDLMDFARGLGGPVSLLMDLGFFDSRERPAWKALMKGVRSGEITAIVTPQLDRITRNAAELLTIVDELIERNVNLIALEPAIELNTPAGRQYFEDLRMVAGINGNRSHS